MELNGSQNKQIRVLVADDHEMLLEMIEIHLSDLEDMTVSTAKTLDAALERIAEHGVFDLVLLDLMMPGMNGIEGLERAIKANQGQPVAILTGNPSTKTVNDIVTAGAAGIVLKTVPLRTLSNAIRFMAAGEHYLPRELTIDRAHTQSHPDILLSEKEMIVLSYLAEGQSNRDIGQALKLAEPTIKMHVRSICTKLGVKNRTQAVVTSRDMGLV